MPKLKTIHYVGIIGLLTVLGVQASVISNQRAIQKNLARLETARAQEIQPPQAVPSPQVAQEIPAIIQDLQENPHPLANEPPQIQQVQNLKPAAGERQYAMNAPAPFVSTDVPQAQQEKIRKVIHRAPLPTAQAPIPPYQPASQKKMPYLSAYVPNPNYRLTPEQEAKLKTEGLPVPAQPVETKPAEDETILGGDVTGTFDITSNYSFRGISQTDGKPAVQGGMEWLRKSGLYLGVWGSSLDFKDNNQAEVEGDLYGGYRSQLSDEISSDVGVIHYGYPGSNAKLHYDYNEVYVSGEYDMPLNADLGGGFKTDKVKFGTAFNYSPQFFAKSGSGYFLKGTAAVPLGNGFTVDGELGKQWIANNTAFGLPDYMEWSLGLAYALPKDFEIKLQYIGTDIAKRKCTNLCGGRTVVSLSKSF